LKKNNFINHRSVNFAAMKNLSWLIILLLLLQSCAQQENLTNEEINEVIDRFDTGWKNKNAASVDSVLDEKYIYFTQSGGTFIRANVVQTAGSKEYLLDEMERKVISITIEGNTAVINTTWRGKGIYYGKPFDDKQRCSMTIIKRKGKISILSEHCTVLQ
jgi:hypothetical protein